MISIEGNIIKLFRANKFIATIYLESTELLTLNTVRGQTEPNILGWYFNTLYDDDPTPISVITVSLKGKNVGIKTTVKFNEN